MRTLTTSPGSQTSTTCKRWPLKVGKPPKTEENRRICLRSMTVWLGASASGALVGCLIPSTASSSKPCMAVTVLTLGIRTREGHAPYPFKVVGGGQLNAVRRR